MDIANILFCSAGRRVSLLRHFRKVLEELKLSGRIIAADAALDAPASQVADEQCLVPRIDDPAYIQALLEVCRQQQVRLLVSLIDTDLVLLSQHKESFEEAGVKLLLCDTATNEICADKFQTHQFFTDNQIPTAKVYTNSDAVGEEDFPLLIKPSKGSAGIGVTKIQGREELLFFRSHIKQPIVQQFITGEEYTLDVYADFHGKVQCVVPRQRLEIRAGEVSKAVTVKDTLMMEQAKAVVEALPHAIGCITVQCFRQADGQLKFIEINPRFGGGFPLSLHAGADFPKWILQELCGIDSDAAMSDWQDDLAMLRYDDEIIVPGHEIK